MKENHWLNKRPGTMLEWAGIIFASIAFYMVLDNLGYFWYGLRTVMHILSPFAGGVVIAYMLDPMVRTFQKKLMHENPKWRWLSMLLAYVVGVLLITMLVWLLVPQFISSVGIFFNNIPTYIQGVQDTLLMIQQKTDVDLNSAVQVLDDYEAMLTQVYSVLSGMVPQLMNYVGGMASNFVAIFTAVASSVYMLADKDHLLHQLRTVTHAILPPPVADEVLRICHYANVNFTGFFIGKIIDSAIIGLLTFIAMTVLRLDFALLISVIVGFTNIIPVFGPFIGAVPGILILLFVDPIQALIFGILILVVQQLDGNIIGPKILGQSIGISALWVLFSIILGGDLFGIPGMVVGVPLFATLYGLAQELVHALLRHRGIDAEGNPLPEAEAPQPAAEKAAPQSDAGDPA